MKSNEVLKMCLTAISDRHGEDTKAYDMRGVSILADYYLVTTAGSNRQLHALANSIIDAAHQKQYTDYRVEGTRDSNWLLLDMGDVIVNIFTKDARDFYNLEKLWANGKEIEVKG